MALRIMGLGRTSAGLLLLCLLPSLAVAQASGERAPSETGKLLSQLEQHPHRIALLDHKIMIGKSAIRSWHEASKAIKELVDQHDIASAECQIAKSLEKELKAGHQEQLLLRRWTAICDEKRKRFRGWVGKLDTDLSKQRVTVDHINENVDVLSRARTQQLEHFKIIEQLLGAGGVEATKAPTLKPSKLLRPDRDPLKKVPSELADSDNDRHELEELLIKACEALDNAANEAARQQKNFEKSKDALANLLRTR